MEDATFCIPSMETIGELVVGLFVVSTVAQLRVLVVERPAVLVVEMMLVLVLEV